MPVNAYSNFSKGWYLGEKLCILSAAFRYILTYAEWMIVALIAFSKCIHLLKPRLGKLVFSGPSGHLIAVLLWLIATLVFLLEHLWVILNFETNEINSILFNDFLMKIVISVIQNILLSFSAWHVWLQLSSRKL